jgi:hypothetical protein
MACPGHGIAGTAGHWFCGSMFSRERIEMESPVCTETSSKFVYVPLL